MAPRSTYRSASRLAGWLRLAATHAPVLAFAVFAFVGGQASAHPFAVAPPPPPAREGATKQDPATSGSTELAGTGKVGDASDIEPMGDDLQFTLSFGSLISTGNARQLAITGGTYFLIRRGRHQFSAEGAGNYGQAASNLDDDLQPTVSNIQGRTRYDIFFAKRFSAFAMATARHDPFQGLNLRLNIDPGLAIYILPGMKERLWAEVGYDFQFDLRTDSARLARDDEGNLLYDAQGHTLLAANKTRLTHATRLFLGYYNQVHEAVAFSSGVEYLQSVQFARRWRLNWNTSLSTLLAKRLSLAATFTLRIDNDPVPRVRKVDTVTALNLVYRFLGAR